MLIDVSGWQPVSNLYILLYIPRPFGRFHIPTVFKGKPLFGGLTVNQVKPGILMMMTRTNASPKY